MNWRSRSAIASVQLPPSFNLEYKRLLLTARLVTVAGAHPLRVANASISWIRLSLVMQSYRDNNPHRSRDDCRLSCGRGAAYFERMRKRFRDALIEHCERTKTSLSAVSNATGVSYEQLKKLRQNKSKSTNVDDAVLIANFFGLSLDEFIGDDTPQKREEILRLYSQLETSERDLLLAAARGFLSQHQAAS